MKKDDALQNFDEAKVLTSPEQGLKEIKKGNAMMKSEVLYHTAVAVQRPRDLDAVVAAVEREAEYAGDDFYYRWPVKTKTGTKIVEGGTIGCALAIAREWTNCAMPVEIEERGNTWIFRTYFVDLERGFTVTRAFRQTIPAAPPGKYGKDRWEDMAFQKAQSQAIRNVIFAGVPRWLRQRAMDRAKEAALKNITKVGIDAARKNVVSYFKGYDVSEAQIKTLIGKPLNEFTADDVQTLRNLGQQIKSGDTSVDDIFSSKPEPVTPMKETPALPPEAKQKEKETAALPAKKDKPKEREQKKEEVGTALSDNLIKCPDGGEMTEKYCNGICRKRKGCASWDEVDSKNKSLLED